MTPNDPNARLRALGDRMDNRQIGAAAGFFGLCRAQEKRDNPSAGRRVLVGLTGRRFVRLMFGVLLQELTRTPEHFTESVAALANGAVREVGESLANFPFEERVRAYEGLSRQLAEGLGIALTPWRPGESAPLDGTVVDLWLTSGRRVAGAWWGVPLPAEEDDGEGWIVDGRYARGEDEEVAFWMPAPPDPPKAAQGEEA